MLHTIIIMLKLLSIKKFIFFSDVFLILSLFFSMFIIFFLFKIYNIILKRIFIEILVLIFFMSFYLLLNDDLLLIYTSVKSHLIINGLFVLLLLLIQIFNFFLIRKISYKSIKILHIVTFLLSSYTILILNYIFFKSFFFNELDFDTSNVVWIVITYKFGVFENLLLGWSDGGFTINIHATLSEILAIIVFYLVGIFLLIKDYPNKNYNKVLIIIISSQIFITFCFFFRIKFCYLNSLGMMKILNLEMILFIVFTVLVIFSLLKKNNQ